MATEYRHVYKNTGNVNRIYNNNYVNEINLPEPKKHRGSGGYYLSAIGSSGRSFGRIFFNVSNVSVLKMLFLVLLLANFVRLVLGDNGLTLGYMLNRMSEIKTIPTDWLGSLTNGIRNRILGASDNIVARNILQILTNLILPLPTILYLLIGLLNVLWWLTSLMSIFFGTFML